MIRISRRFRFEAAHALFNHKGACRNIHGHSYILDVTISGHPVKQQGSDEGMVMDFADLKALVQEEIIDHYDHSLVLNRNYYDASAIPEAMRTKINWLDVEPTSENLVLLFARKLKQRLPPRLLLHQLVLRETANTSAAWYHEDNL